MANPFSENRFYILDGAMGTELQKAGLMPGERPELLTVTKPALVENVHRAYAQSGADFICANTFGCNAKKLAGCGYSVAELVTAAVACARRGAEGTGAQVMLDVGPIGELLEPNGTLRFEEAYELFKEIVLAGEQAGAALVLFETMTDLYECKAAVLAAKENTKLPVLVSMTFEANGRTFTGCPVEAMAATMTGLGADALGINCSLGPVEILPLASALCAATPLPVFIKPNAGLPDPATGEYAYTPERFCAEMQDYKALGVAAVGGCCGTTPAMLRALAEAFHGEKRPARTYTPKSVVCSSVTAVPIDGVAVIGERINPTGKKRMKEALRTDDMDYLLTQAIEQADAGAHILDVNVGLPEIDECALMPRAVKAIQGVCDLPLQLDSTRADVLAAGLRVYNGKPIVNSVNGEQASLDAILPLCKKYGAAVVGLTLDENGIPSKAQARFAIAERILQAALAAGIPREDVYIDCLTLTASAQQEDVVETLRAVRMVKEQLGLRTVLGVSNVSFGLPCREQLNATFLTLALAHGLDLPILNPNNAAMMAAVDSFNVLYARDAQAAAYIARYANAAPAQTPPGEAPSLHGAILQGLKAPAAEAARQALLTQAPEALVSEVLIPALDEVGDRFEKGVCFLPQLLQSAGAAQAAFDVVRAALAKQKTPQAQKGPIVIATVKGDIHDIGKNIVKTILENYGYQMIDLGRDVPPEDVVHAAQKHGALLVGLSALMTTTLGSMQDTIAALHAALPSCKVMVGGAVLTPDYAAHIGADYYAKDAKASVDIAKQVFGA